MSGMWVQRGSVTYTTLQPGWNSAGRRPLRLRKGWCGLYTIICPTSLENQVRRMQPSTSLTITVRVVICNVVLSKQKQQWHDVLWAWVYCYPARQFRHQAWRKTAKTRHNSVSDFIAESVKLISVAMAMIWEQCTRLLGFLFFLNATLHLIPVEYSSHDSLASPVCSNLLMTTCLVWMHNMRQVYDSCQHWYLCRELHVFNHSETGCHFLWCFINGMDFFSQLGVWSTAPQK